MANNTRPSDNPTVATDEIGGINYQRVKIAVGGEGVADDVSSSAPFPIRSSLATVATPSKVSVGTSSTAIVSADSGRTHPVLVHVLSGGPVFVNDATATVDGFPIPTGGTLEWANTLGLNGIVASGAADVRVLVEA